MTNINTNIAKGAAWMVLFKLIDRSIGLLSTVILARILVPEDFGLVAMSMMLVAALELLVAFSFDVALIQNRNAGRDQFDTAWTFNVIFATVCAIVMALLAEVTARFYHEPRLVSIIYVLAIGFAAQGFSNIGTVTFRREMQFDREFKFLLSKRLTTFLITIPLALILRNYWTLVIGQISGTLFSVALSYYFSTYRPRFSLKARLELFHSSKWLMINNVLQFVNNRAVQFILGRSTGAQTLGTYAIAAEISSLPTTELIAPINRAAFPGYAKAARDKDELRAIFLKVIASIALFALPAGVGIVAVADLLVPVVLGQKWLAAIPLIQILAVYGVIQALQTNIAYVYLAVGNQRLITIISAVQAAILVAVLIPSVQAWGVTGAAWATLATIVLMIPVNQVLIARCLDLSATQFGAQLVRPLIASLLLGTAVLFLKASLPAPATTVGYLLTLLLCVAVGALVYAGMVFALWKLASSPAGPEHFCLLKLDESLKKIGLKVNFAGGLGR